MSLWNKDDDETNETVLQKGNLDDNDKIEDDENKTAIDCDEYGIDISRFMKQEYKGTAQDNVKDIVCNMCHNSFGKNRYLKQHKIVVHSLDRKFTCLICNKGCVSKGELVTHLKCHSKQRDFICDRCSETFITNSCLKAHKRKHDGTMLQCKTCGKQFSRAQHLNAHVRFVHLN